ncbi:MAG: hypothetical protein M1816_003498 [Peltula sp. TS41687]|nr:MAG: hypothetical protein M1816_003498 [Peltula sp. TS41687]
MPFGRFLKNCLPPSHSQDNNEPPNQSQQHGYQPPSKPMGQEEQFQPPSYPPPSQQPSQQQYLPPPGPPPGHTTAPPPDYGPPQHDWTSVPDTSLLPPPPSLGHEFSPTSNAPAHEAEQAKTWCRQYPLYAPRSLSSSDLSAIQDGQVQLVKPQSYTGDLYGLGSPGSWHGRTWSGCRDACLLTNLPLYSASHHSPLMTERSKTIYYEVRIIAIGRPGETGESSIALGFAAQPYPTWRMPGWERASLAVHSDDGRRYVNDDKGGKDFTAPFKKGERVGLGMSFAINPEAPKMKVDIFFTRNGKRVGGWDLHEQLDMTEQPVTEGLDGSLDVYPAVGVYGGVDFEVVFNQKEWLWKEG